MGLALKERARPSSVTSKGSGVKWNLLQLTPTFKEQRIEYYNNPPPPTSIISLRTTATNPTRKVLEDGEFAKQVNKSTARDTDWWQEKAACCFQTLFAGFIIRNVGREF